MSIAASSQNATTRPPKIDHSSVERTKIAVVAIGDELLDGRSTDRNSSFIGRWCRAHGATLEQVFVVGDDESHIAQAISLAAACAPVVVTSGGLGPTTDDRTRNAVATLLHPGQKETALEFNDEAAERLRSKFAVRGRPMPENNLRQCWFPRGADIHPNSAGTADAFSVQISAGLAAPDVNAAEAATRKQPHATAIVVSFPGVPAEFERFATQLLPGIAGTGEARAYWSSYLVGIGESRVGELVESLQLPSAIKVTYCAHFPTVELELSAAEAAPEFEAACAALSRIFAPWSLAASSKSAAQALASICEARNASGSMVRVVTAESCTGGLIASELTNLPGASGFFDRGWITYSNASKVAELRVAAETLETFGAVSAQTVAEMASGARRQASAGSHVGGQSADFLGIAVSGIAGPTGGSVDKPLGTVFVAVATAAKIVVVHAVFAGVDRSRFKALTASLALYSAVQLLEGDVDHLRSFFGVLSVETTA